MRVVLCEPHKNAKIIDDAPDLNMMNNKWMMVQGYYSENSSYYASNRIICLYNQVNDLLDATRKDLGHCRNVKPHSFESTIPEVVDFNRLIARRKPIYGNLVLAGVDSRGRYTDLTPAQIAYVMRNWGRPQKFNSSGTMEECNEGDETDPSVTEMRGGSEPKEERIERDANWFPPF